MILQVLRDAGCVLRGFVAWHLAGCNIAGHRQGACPSVRSLWLQTHGLIEDCSGTQDCGAQDRGAQVGGACGHGPSVMIGERDHRGLEAPQEWSLRSEGDNLSTGRGPETTSGDHGRQDLGFQMGVEGVRLPGVRLRTPSDDSAQGL